MSEIKPCPFCGEPALVQRRNCHIWPYEAECVECYATVKGDDVDDAIEAWNKRVHGVCRDCKHRNGHYSDCDFLANIAKNVDIFDLYFDLPEDFYCANWKAKKVEG